MGKFVVIGERIHCISPAIREAMNTMNPEPILKRAKEQLEAGATYLDVNIGPAESNGVELMTWAVKTIQDAFDNVPLALDTANMKAIEAGIAVYNRAKGSPSSTPLTPATVSSTSTWPPTTTPSPSPCAPRPAFPPTMTSA